MSSENKPPFIRDKRVAFHLTVCHDQCLVSKCPANDDYIREISRYKLTDKEQKKYYEQVKQAIDNCLNGSVML